MRLEGNFYHILEIQPNESGWVIKVGLEANHPIYAGHFPGQPIVPGACTLTIIKECLEKVWQPSFVFHNIKDCKFLSVLQPHEGLELKLDIKTDGPTVRCTVYETDQVVMKLKAAIA